MQAFKNKIMYMRKMLLLAIAAFMAVLSLQAQPF